MARTRKDLKTLLLQIRDDERGRTEEWNSFLTFTELEKSQMDVLNVFETPVFKPNVLDGYDALFIGGASEASVLDPSYEFNNYSIELIRYAAEKGVPTFASCYGFQLAVLAFGGEVIDTPDDFEMGSVAISLTAAAGYDVLFRDTPDGFMAISVHQQKSMEAPAGCVKLAYTDACCHAFRLKGKPFWAFQFHPEVTREVLVDRLGRYREKYTDDLDHFNEVIAKTVDTPVSNELVDKFVERVLLK